MAYFPAFSTKRIDYSGYKVIPSYVVIRDNQLLNKHVFWIRNQDDSSSLRRETIERAITFFKEHS